MNLVCYSGDDGLPVVLRQQIIKVALGTILSISAPDSSDALAQLSALRVVRALGYCDTHGKHPLGPRYGLRPVLCLDTQN